MGTSAFANSVASATGLASPPGRAVVRILNWPLATYLDDAADNIEDGNWRRTNDPSPAAAAMVAQEHHRHKGRRLAPMPPETRDAALAYLRERIELIAQARDLFCVVHRRRSSALQRRLHMLAQHKKYMA